ncbi:hypothetical protein [Pararhodonellum marinum]|uniref:hypothetical protein n=1 Tax=Pararhodonellum marinum TaxID=2755358 RepID=UPI0018905AA6|nr:hypothetical protein [Pararhodonellum marinum]
MKKAQCRASGFNFAESGGLIPSIPEGGEAETKACSLRSCGLFPLQSPKRAWSPAMKKARCRASGFGFAESGGLIPSIPEGGRLKPKPAHSVRVVFFPCSRPSELGLLP